MNRRHLGLTAPQFIVALVVVVVVAGVVLYFTSDVFRTKMDAQYDQLAHWTPENIAKDPENYLNFCETQTKKALMDLKANEISIAQSRGGLETMKTESDNKVQVGTKALAELKDLYTRTESANSWPAQWKGENRDKEWVKRQVIALDKQIRSQQALLSKAQAGLQKLDAQVLRIQDAKAKAQEQLQDIEANRQTLKVSKITDSLTKQLVSMKGVLEATLSSATETSGIVSLDQLTAEAAPAVSDAEFDKIMGGSTTTKP
jgi:chromosome segregation ATPase